MKAHDWPRAQALSLHVPGLGLLVDLSKTSLKRDALARDPLVTAVFPVAFAAMALLEAGEIANPDEKRRVGHYWLRAPERAPDAETAEAIRGTLRRIEDFARAVHAGRLAPQKAPRFTNLLVVGIGGSALGPQFVADALGSPRDPLRPFFFDNTDPDGMVRELSRIAATDGGLPATLTVVISKSGGTKETRNGMLVAADAYRKAGLAFAKHAVAVTGAESELDEVAAKDGWLERFPMWDWVGGRTSELSAVGLLPAALQGFDIEAMLAGAAACDEATRVPVVARNPAAMLALAWHAETGGRGAKDMVVLPYKDRLLLFSRYLQQLVMESLGKEKDLEGRVVNQGIAVYGNKGSTDQHAYVQQLREGVPNFFVTFLEVEKDREDGALSLEVEPDVTPGDYLHGFLLGTRKALAENGRGVDHDHRARRLARARRNADRALRAGRRPLRVPRRDQRVPPARRRGRQEGRGRRPRAAGQDPRRASREEGRVPDRGEDRRRARREGRRDRLRRPPPPRCESRPRRLAQGRADVLSLDVRGVMKRLAPRGFSPRP